MKVRTEDSYGEANARSTKRLRHALDRLSDDELGIELGHGWTKAAVLAHLAFWDRLAADRWRRWLAGSEPIEIDGPQSDLINDAALAQWRSLSPAAVRRDVLAAAETVDKVIADAPPGRVAEILASGRRRWAFRSDHRNEHQAEL